jgi:hypothetical protein
VTFFLKAKFYEPTYSTVLLKETYKSHQKKTDINPHGSFAMRLILGRVEIRGLLFEIELSIDMGFGVNLLLILINLD